MLSRLGWIVTYLMASVVSAAASAADPAPVVFNLPYDRPITSTDAAWPDANCATDSRDPWERPVSIAGGSRYKAPVLKNGVWVRQCLDTKKDRAPEVWPAQSTKHVWTVTNVYHAGKFWIGYIPVDDSAIESMTLLLLRQREFLIVTSGHGELEIKLRVPATLVSQDDGEQTQISDFIYSAEAIYPANQPIDGLHEIAPNIPIVGRLASAEQRKIEDGALFQRYDRYPFTDAYNEVVPGYRGRLWQAMIQYSSDRGFRDFYRLIKRNCVTVLMGIIEQTLPPVRNAIADGQDQTFKAHFMFQFPIDPVLTPALKTLERRGIVEGAEK